MTDLYEVLGVPADASEDAIRRAYRAAARREHPDVSAHPDASDRMAMLNEAFAVLSDPAARAGYDRYCHMPSPVAPEAEEWDDEELYPWLRCERCGAATPDLRFRVFVWVASAVVATFRRTTPGLFCARCRRRLAWSRSLTSVALGPWGFPFGPFLTVAAVFRNARGGHRDPMVDANFDAMLRQAGRDVPAAEAPPPTPGRPGRMARIWRPLLGSLLFVAAVALVAVVIVGAYDRPGRFRDDPFPLAVLIGAPVLGIAIASRRAVTSWDVVTPGVMTGVIVAQAIGVALLSPPLTDWLGG